MRFRDPRRFGLVLWLESNPMEHVLLRNLGPEPFDPACDGDYLFNRSRGRSVAVKNFIMDGHIIVGVGNIYANEALFLARIHPARRACTVRRHEADALHHTLRSVLSDAVRAEGTTIRDYRNAQGGEGKYGRELKVYGQEGSPCIRCNSIVQRVVFGDRSAFLCPTCQPRRAVARRPQNLGLT